MIRFFESLPGLCQAFFGWSEHHPLTLVLVGFVVSAILWLNLFAMVERRNRAAAEKANRDRRLPGSFPGDR